MREQVFELEEKFQPYLLEGDYTFVGPSDQTLLPEFTNTANLIAPVVAISRTVHHALSHQGATRQALNNLPADTPVRVYVVPSPSPLGLIHATIEDYCKKYDIDFN